MRQLDTLNLAQEAAHVSMAVEMLRWGAWWQPSHGPARAPDGED
jgi:hypothetical protein